MQQVYVAHYHEIALKGRNRPMFLHTLQENICRATGLSKKEVKIVSGRLLVHCPPNHPRPLPQGEREIVLREETKLDPYPLMGDGRVRMSLSHVFGISSFSPAVLVKAHYDEIQGALNTLILESMRVSGKWNTFAVSASRGDKRFPMTSQELNVKLGAFVNEKFGKKVNLTNPEITFYVEVFQSGALVYTERISGPGGLPVGTQGKVAVMLSGGIDSPVAAYRIMKRGAPIIGVHCHSYPFTTRASIDKVKELAGILAQYGGPIKLYLVPLAEAQKAVVQNCEEKYRVLLYRRLMVRIAGALAVKEGAQMLVTGEALGQVASQTVENMTVVEAVIRYRHPEPGEGSRATQESRDSSALPRNDKIWMPIFRPLIGYDKEEIITEARQIGTYEISILPHDDCCTLMMPKNPATRARLSDVEREEQKINMSDLINATIERVEQVNIPT